MTNIKNNYKIICATPHNKQTFLEKSQLSLFLDKENIINSDIIYENKEGLPKVYNSFINEQNINYKLIFVHDDVLIEDLFFFEKLETAFEKYDIVGLAGTKSCNLKSEVTAWHYMSKNKQDLVGEVCHSKDKQFWTTVFGPTDSRALLLDGLFLAVNTKKLLETNTKFDENFTFHHYDISFCINANKNKLKMGVFPIKVTHFGLGDSMLTSDWHSSAKNFKRLYCNG